MFSAVTVSKWSALLAAIAVAVMVYLPSVHDVERYNFIGSWFDQASGVTKRFDVSYFPSDNAVQLYDPDLRRTILRRIQCPDVSKADFTRGLGHHVVVFSRRIKLVGYLDEVTAAKCEVLAERTFAMVKPDGVAHLGEILASLGPLTISQAQMFVFSYELAVEFYKEHEGKSFFEGLIEYVTSGPVVGLELAGTNAVLTWRNLIGPTDPAKARVDDPSTIRARFGQSVTFNAVHGSDSVLSARRELELIFKDGARPKVVPTSKPLSCLVVLPHTVKSGKLGNVIQDLQRNDFEIRGLLMSELTEKQAGDFLEVYDTVLKEYSALVQQLASGPCVALAVSARSASSDVVRGLRELCGPSDISLAKRARPESLRAKFAESQVKKGVHCSDLDEFGRLECEYFFDAGR